MTSSPFLSRATASASTPTIRWMTSASCFTPCGATPRWKICERRAVPSIASMTSSRSEASWWMSSRSSGVMNVRSSRFTTSCVTWSASCSRRLITSTCGVRRSGGASNSSRRCWAASLLRLGTSTKRWKNSSSPGNRRTAVSGRGKRRGEHSGLRREPLGYPPTRTQGEDRSMATTQQPQTEFVKAISRLDATALVVGSMIGSGIFIVSAQIIRDVHAPGLLLLVWALSGGVTLMGAVTYGELAAMFPKAGGQYVYLRESISPLFGYLYGWTLFAVIQTGTIAAVAVAFARFTAVVVPGLGEEIFLGGRVGHYNVGFSAQRVLAIVSIIALTWINIRGVKTAAIIQTTLTIIKTAAVLALIVLGVTVGRHADAIAANFGAAFWPAGGLTLALVPVIGAAMVGSLFSMDAWNNVGFASGEMKYPEKDIPFAMAVGVLIVTSLYLLANLAYINVLPADAIKLAWTEGRPPVGTAALQAMFGDVGLTVMAVAIMISTFGCNNGLILAGAPLYYPTAPPP